jgi:hypothetical protein
MKNIASFFNFRNDNLQNLPNVCPQSEGNNIALVLCVTLKAGFERALKFLRRVSS